MRSRFFTRPSFTHLYDYQRIELIRMQRTDLIAQHKHKNKSTQTYGNTKTPAGRPAWMMDDVRVCHLMCDDARVSV